jgi:hypothetical protein
MALFEPTSRIFTAEISTRLDLVRKSLIAKAKLEHQKVMDTDPRPIAFTRFVDGKKGEVEDAAGFRSVILYIYSRLDMVAKFALNALIEGSPERTGRYKASHVLYLNGMPVADLTKYQAGDEIAISNTLPYSRKIEVGSMRMRVPGTDHVYQKAMQRTRRNMGNLATVRFEYREIIGVHRAKAGSRFPVLVITER